MINTNPPTVVFGISLFTLTILPIFSKLVTAGVNMSFSFNIISSLTLSFVRNISSSLILNSKGDILPPRRMRTPSFVVTVSSFLNVFSCYRCRSCFVHFRIRFCSVCHMMVKLPYRRFNASSSNDRAIFIQGCRHAMMR